MRFCDFSPAPLPSLAQQRDALQKGLGRALQWARNGCLGDELLLEACLHDKRFDVQVDRPRGDWLWRIMQAAGAVGRFRVPILHALYGLTDERSASQHCELARHYAETGDDAFRMQLYEIVRRKPLSDSPWLGEKEIIELDREKAFVFAARVRGERLATEEWDWHDEIFVNRAVEKLGEKHISEALTASPDPQIGRFFEKWRDQSLTTSKEQQSSHRSRMRSTSVDDIIEAAKGPERCFWFQGWGMHADDVELKSILVAIWEADDPNIVSKLLRVFSKRSLPEFDPRLIELCQHDDEEIRSRAFTALAENADAAVRKFALQQIATNASGLVIGLFTKNFESGDEERILEAITLPEDADQIHWLLLTVIRMLEANPDADCSQLAIITYGSTPCQLCRCDAAQLLHNRNTAPAWLVEECRLDAEESCRRLFIEPTKQ